MSDSTHEHCAHVDQKLRWFGYRQHQGHKFYLFQCLGCGKSFASPHPLPSQDATGPLEALSGLSRL